MQTQKLRENMQQEIITVLKQVLSNTEELYLEKKEEADTYWLASMNGYISALNLAVKIAENPKYLQMIANNE